MEGTHSLCAGAKALGPRATGTEPARSAVSPERIWASSCIVSLASVAGAERVLTQCQLRKDRQLPPGTAPVVFACQNPAVGVLGEQGGLGQHSAAFGSGGSGLG